MNGRFDMAGHFYILLTLLFTVYGQLVLKWQMGQARTMPEGGLDKLLFLLQQLVRLSEDSALRGALGEAGRLHFENATGAAFGDRIVYQLANSLNEPANAGA